MLVWVLAMMGFYWLLAICAVGVVLATVLKLKEFETATGRGVEARRRRSRVVSFLSHNGVLIY